MGRYLRRSGWVALALVIGGMVVAPVELYAAGRSSPTAVSISDIKSVAGRWSGILYGRPGGQRGQDWIELALHEDGTYTLASARTIGVFEGSGKVSLADGRLVAEGEKARATFTLYQRDGKRFLRVDGSMASGQPLQADLYPAP
jgi:hypothetical protein